MPGDVDDVLRLADRAAIAAKLAELRTARDGFTREIEKRERFLALLDEWSPQEAGSPAVTSGNGSTVPDTVTAPRASTSPHERREAVLTVLRRKPDAEWSLDSIRSALDQLSVSFEGGTPLKNILYGMVQKDVIERPRTGWYKLAATGGENGTTGQGELSP